MFHQHLQHSTHPLDTTAVSQFPQTPRYQYLPRCFKTLIECLPCPVDPVHGNTGIRRVVTASVVLLSELHGVAYIIECAPKTGGGVP